MATINQPQEENQGPANGAVPIAGTSGSISGQGKGGGASAPATSQINPNAGVANQGYTDVSSYLNANQAGSQQLGNQVAQNLTNTYNQTNSDINNASQNFQNQVGAGYTPENTQLIQQAEANPTAVAGNAANVTAYQNMVNDAYTGPTAWNDTTNSAGATTSPGYGTLQGEVALANQYGALPTTSGGNQLLAQQVESQNGGSQGAGISSLDALLLGGPGAAGTVQAAAAPYANLTNTLNTANTTNLADVTNAQNTAAQTAADALNAFTGANGTLTNLNNTINTTAQNDLTAAQQQQQALQTALTNAYNAPYASGVAPGIQDYNVNPNALSPAQLQELGLTQAQWNTLQGALNQAGTSQYETAPNFGNASQTGYENLTNYLSQQTPSATNINAANTATPQQYAEVAAINQLLGTQAPLQTEAINPALASLAGTYNPANMTNLDQFNYNQALQDAQNASASEIAAAQNASNAQSAAALAQHNAGHGGFLSSLESVAPFIANPTLALGATSLGKEI